VRIKTLLKFVIALVAVGGLVYWFRFSPVKAQAHKVVRGALVDEVMGTGTLEAKLRASISPKISGLLVRVLVDQNDKVAKGQLVAQLDDGDLRQQVEVAQADLAAAKATVDRLGAEIVSATATAVQARSNFERVSLLRKSQAAAENELEKAVESHDVAKSSLSRALLAKIEAERAVNKAEASLRFYQERLGDADLRAPFDGLVLRRNRDPGSVVVPGSSILDMVSTEQLWVSAWVDETAMGALAVGQPARVVFRSNAGSPVVGKVMRLSPETDRETREFLVDVGVSKMPGTWAVGQRAEVYIETGRRGDALLVPQRLVIWRNGQPGVLLDKDGKARWQKIALGLRGREDSGSHRGLELRPDRGRSRSGS